MTAQAADTPPLAASQRVPGLRRVRQSSAMRRRGGPNGRSLLLAAMIAGLVSGLGVATAPRAEAARYWYEDDQAGSTYARLDYTEDKASAERFSDVGLQVSRAG